MATRNGERIPPSATTGAPKGPPSDNRTRRRSLELPQPVPDLLRSALILRLRALANHNRFRVWDELRKGEATVSELTATLPMSQQTVSASLHELQRAGLADRLQVGARACYRLTDASAEHAFAIHQLSIERRAMRFARELHDAHQRSTDDSITV